MVWARNLLFLAVCLAGLAAVAGALSPLGRPADFILPSRPRPIAADFHDTVSRLDDAFHRQWQSDGIEPVARADDLTIARRLSLSLMGTIPSLEEIRRLEGLPRAAGGAHQGDSGRLRHQAEWIQHWLDGVFADRRWSDYLAERLARAFVGTQDGPFLVYRRRRFVSWLAEQLHAGRPYDAIAGELIASSGGWTSQPATNFVTVTITADRRVAGPDENALAARTARAFLGIRLDCAECHDHPFEPWTKTDFQSLAAFYSQTESGLPGIRDRNKPVRVEDRSLGQEVAATPAVPFASELLPSAGPLRQRLAGWVTHPDNKAFARATVNRFWAILFGRPLVEPIDDIRPDDEHPPALDILADDLAAHGYDLRRLIRLIAASKAFQLDSRASGQGGQQVTAEQQAAWAAFGLSRLRPEQIVGSLLQASSVRTLDHHTGLMVRTVRAINQRDFIVRFGDAGEDEFSPQGGTIPQQLLLMNGRLVRDKIREPLLSGAAAQIHLLAPDDSAAVEAAWLAVLSRRPSPEEQAHFVARLAQAGGGRLRRAGIEDLYWALINSTEFSWNH